MTNCKKCGERLDVTHTYDAAGLAKTQRAECAACHLEYVVTWAAPSVELAQKKGEGAYAVARKIENGKLTVEPTKLVNPKLTGSLTGSSPAQASEPEE